MRIVEHKDLMEKYENPIQHACDMREGQVFITDTDEVRVNDILSGRGIEHRMFKVDSIK